MFMLTKLINIANSSKYTTIYCKIIMNAQKTVDIYSTRAAKKREAIRLKGYVEAHHIIPRSIESKYIKDSNNLVYLTPKEHYICHLLLTKMFNSKVYTTKMLFAFTRVSSKHKIKAAMFNTIKSKHAEANRQKAIKAMQDPVTKDKFIKAGAEAGKKIRDADPKAWVSQSMGSKEGRKRAKQSCQTSEFREFCKNRELSKATEDRQKLAKQGQQALVDKCGGEEAYRKMLSDRIKGRKAYVHPITGQVKITYECPDGFVPKKVQK